MQSVPLEHFNALPAYPRALVELIFSKNLWPACNEDEESAFDEIILHAKSYKPPRYSNY